jgi:hypothetical protein
MVLPLANVSSSLPSTVSITSLQYFIEINPDALPLLMISWKPFGQAVDLWFFDWLQEAVFSNRDFHEASNGAIRISRPLTSNLV